MDPETKKKRSKYHFLKEKERPKKRIGNNKGDQNFSPIGLYELIIRSSIFQKKNAGLSAL